MTATDRLRALLDERGVEWWAEDDPEEPAYSFTTKWFVNGCEQTYEEIPAIRSRALKAYCVTPEQAVEATLGREECWSTWDIELTGRLRFQCSECKAVSLEIVPFYCPACGRKVVK